MDLGSLSPSPVGAAGRIIAIPTLIYSTLAPSETLPAAQPLIKEFTAPPGFMETLHGIMVPDHASFSSNRAVEYKALMATNSISIISCVAVLVTYAFMLYKYPRIMQRLSLRLCACIAVSDLVLHISNLVGYGKLPVDGWLCSVFGGFLFAAPTMLSLFYTCAIAINFQLVFVFAKRARQSREKFFFIVPPAVVAILCLPTLFTYTYGYDIEFDYCWYSTDGLSSKTIIIRMMATYGFWCFLAMLYLLFASVTVIIALHNPDTACLQISATVDGFAHPSQEVDVIRTRKSAVRRLGLRLIGFIIIPLLCVIVGVILDLASKAGVPVSTTVDSVFEVIAGLSGFFNCILFFLDPAVLAIKESGWKMIQEDEAKRGSFTVMQRRKPAPPHEDIEKHSIQKEDSLYERKFNELQSDLGGL